jgi:enoyl-CoA hydratase/carnithine racemase
MIFPLSDADRLLAATAANDVLLDITPAGVAYVTLNRPGKLNALTQAMCLRFAETIGSLSARTDIRCVVIRGAGKGFCPGADIGEFAEARSTVVQARRFNDIFHGAVETVPACPHPTVAVIQGACVGGGLQLACACDLRLTADNGKFGVPVNRLGLAVDYRELAPIIRIAGEAAALEILLTGAVCDAARARALGLVNDVVPLADLPAAADRLVAAIVAGAPLVNRWHKRFIRRLADGGPLSEAELAEPFACYETADYREGWNAFLEKRPPQFSGR